MIEAVIFDLDGVLTKSDHYHTSAWRQTCEQWGIPFADSTGDLVRGVSRLESARIVAVHGGVELTQKQLATFAEEKNSNYVRLLEDMNATDVIPGVSVLLKHLAGRRDSSGRGILQQKRASDSGKDRIEGLLHGYCRRQPDYPFQARSGGFPKGGGCTGNPISKLPGG